MSRPRSYDDAGDAAIPYTSPVFMYEMRRHIGLKTEWFDENLYLPRMPTPEESQQLFGNVAYDEVVSVLHRLPHNPPWIDEEVRACGYYAALTVRERHPHALARFAAFKADNPQFDLTVYKKRSVGRGEDPHGFRGPLSSDPMPRVVKYETHPIYLSDRMDYALHHVCNIYTALNFFRSVSDSEDLALFHRIAKKFREPPGPVPDEFDVFLRVFPVLTGPPRATNPIQTLVGWIYDAIDEKDRQRKLIRPKNPVVYTAPYVLDHAVPDGDIAAYYTEFVKYGDTPIVTDFTTETDTSVTSDTSGKRCRADIVADAEAPPPKRSSRSKRR